MKPHIEYIEECPSTNNVAKERHDAPHGLVLASHKQTAGRGQRGNSWEAEPGKNLTFSMVLRPKGIRAAAQFELSMLVALAILKVLRPLGVEASVKWPNDIYFGDRKLAGLLIENEVAAEYLDKSIVGIGLNVNQEKFLSDAPNPVSLKQILGTDLPLETLLEDICATILDEVDAYTTHPDPEALSSVYFSNLWRADGAFYPFFIPSSGSTVEAAIENVAADGTLSIRTSENDILTFLFKEVEFLI